MGLFDLRPKKVSNVRQTYWKAQKVPIFKQRNDDDRLGEKREKRVKKEKEDDFNEDTQAEKHVWRHESGYAD